MGMNMLLEHSLRQRRMAGSLHQGQAACGGKYLDFLGGEAGIMCLSDHAKKRGAEILNQMEVREIIRKDSLSGDVLGVKVKDIATNKEILIRAKRAVVLSAGGFGPTASCVTVTTPT